jgi:hypothetical protein
VTIQAGFEAELPFLQAEALALMTLTLAASSPGGTTTDADGMETAGLTPQGTTPGKLQGSTARDAVTRSVSVGDVERPVVDEGLHIPLSAPLPKIGWQYEVTAVGPSDDPALLGRRFQVVSVPAKSFATARRLDVVEVTP